LLFELINGKNLVEVLIGLFEKSCSGDAFFLEDLTEILNDGLAV